MKIKIKNFEVHIDKDDFELISKFKWHLSATGYAAARPRYSLVKDGYARCYMHRLIMGDIKGKHIDHINGNKLDNRKNNLRYVTRSQQMWNTRIPRNNTSGFKGVSLNKRNGMWMAKLNSRYKLYYLGEFKTPEEAFKVYCKAVKELHGEYMPTQKHRLIKVVAIQNSIP